MSKCQCPKPESIRVDKKDGYMVIPLWAMPGTTLHYKKADRECRFCGNPVCDDCSYDGYCKACKEGR